MSWVGWLWIGFSVIGALIFTALIWLGGPVVFIGDAQPLEGVWSRLALITLIWLIVLGTIAWRVISRRRAAAALEKAITDAVLDDSDAPILKGKMEDALATLKRTSGSNSGALYDLPWYLIIGPPGAGKTTALINSGLKFPLAGDNVARAVQGIGGTRYCDWWFTDQAVLIDTAGRYTTQDSDAKIDRKSWLAFLDMLRQNRPRQPINGVIVAISIADVLGLSATEVNAHADAIRKRLDELHMELKVNFPVYAIFTKMDLIAGFTQYFADLDEVKRQAVWGATFQTADRKANNVGQTPAELDLLIQRISERMPERLQDEPDLRSRAILFGLPAQLSAIRGPVADFLNRIFEPTRYQSTATLRGFYFTSGTQEGTPFDSVIGALKKSFGVESLGGLGFTGPGKSFFLHDLLVKVVFGEAGWVSTNIAAVRRSLMFRAAIFTLIGLVTVGTLALWSVSYARNVALIAATRDGIESYVDAAGPLIAANSLKDSDLRQVYQLIDSLPYLPVGYAHREDPTPLNSTFGLSQRPRVEDVSVGIYQAALERLVRPRLVLALERELQRNVDNPNFVYEALKVYLMLGGQAPRIDKDSVISWFTTDWERRTLPDAPNADARARLRAHLQAMLDLDIDGASKITLNRDLVDQARQTLARLPMADRAYTLLKSTIYTPPIRDWIALEHGGPGMATVFETANNAPLETVRVPGFFTYEGFYRALLDPMPSIAQKLQKEKWVLGSLAEQGPVSDQYSNLPDAILERYRNEFIAAWNVALGNLQLRPLLSDKPKYLALSAASSPASPLVYLFESIRNETALTRERKKPQPNESMSQGENEALYAVRNRLGSTERIALDLALKNQRKASDPPPSIPGAAIEDNFREYYKLVDGEPRGRLIDALLENLNQLYTDLNVAATNPTQSKQALEQAEQQVGYLSANVSRLPQPLRGWIDKVAKDAAGDTARDATARTIADLSDAMAENVTAPCQQIISGRYPFFGKGQDVPLADFGRLFAQGGIIERFFSTSLAPLVNMTGRTWTWRPNSNLTHRLSDVTLRQFQQAAEIRDAFFATGSAPNVNLEVKLNSLDASAQTSTLTVGGGPPIVSQSNSNTGSTLQWPGVGPSGASIALAPELPDQGKSVKEREGPWALFRLIDDGSVTPRGSSIVVGFIVGGRDVSYQFNASSLVNPLTMSSLRQFRCPNGL